MKRSWVVLIAKFCLVVIISTCAWLWSRPKGPPVPPQSPDTTLANLYIKVIEAKESEMGESFVKVQICNQSLMPKAINFPQNTYEDFSTDNRKIQIPKVMWAGLNEPPDKLEWILPRGCSSQFIVPIEIVDVEPKSTVTFRMGWKSTIWSEPISLKVHMLPAAKRGDITIWKISPLGPTGRLGIGLMNRRPWPIAIDVNTCHFNEIDHHYILTDNRNVRVQSNCSESGLIRRHFVIRPFNSFAEYSRVFTTLSFNGKPGSTTTFKLGLLLSGKAHQVKQRPALLKDAIWSDPVTLKVPVE